MSKSLPHLLKNEESSRVAEPLGATTRSSLHLTITNAQEEGPPTLPRKMGEDAQKGEEVSAFHISLPLQVRFRTSAVLVQESGNCYSSA